MEVKKHMIDVTSREATAKAGEEANTVITVKNGLSFTIVVTCTNSALGMISSANILPGESQVMPTGICAAVDVYCWYGNQTGVNWEGLYPVFVMHYHDVHWTVWAGTTTEFKPKAAKAGG